jgi:hypothetical protein
MISGWGALEWRRKTEDSLTGPSLGMAVWETLHEERSPVERGGGMAPAPGE